MKRQPMETDMTYTVLVAPSGFKESMGADEAAEAIAAGVRKAMPEAKIRMAPMVDGGEGFTKAIVEATGGQQRQVTVTGPVGKPVESFFGFMGGSESRTAVMEMAAAAWEKAKELIRDPANHMVLLDEINIALRYDYIPIEDVVTFLSAEKPDMTHVVLTGRNAKDELIEIADLATEMTQIKHPFRDWVKAQVGIEF